MQERTRGRWACAVTSASVAWAVALLPAAFLLPVYGTSGANPVIRSGGQMIVVQHGDASLIAVNGASLQLMLLIALPAAFAGIAWIGLHRACTRGGVSGRRLATTTVLLLAALTRLTGFSIGIEVLPALVLLTLGRALTPTASPQPGV